MKIKIIQKCLGRGRVVLLAGMLLDLPNAEAYELLVAGRAKPADDDAVATVKRMSEQEMRRAGLTGPTNVRHIAHAARVHLGKP
ncbi:MAG: hypothetical protein H6933_11865 [Burkholderiaceae bacterium]|nr:hypothetical protein [Burkholderiaceae bacterium]